MSRFRPEVFTNNNPSNTILVTYSTARFWVCGFTNHAGLSNYCTLDDQTRSRSKRATFRTALPRKCQVHICTHVPSFQNAAGATQFSGSRHFQFCLPAPSSSCLFLPTTARLALVVRLYLPFLTLSICSALSLCFIGYRF